jgi:hypothetical protein
VFRGESRSQASTAGRLIGLGRPGARAPERTRWGGRLAARRLARGRFDATAAPTGATLAVERGDARPLRLITK